MDHRAVRVFEHVTIGDDAIVINEEPAAARKLLATRVKCFDRYCGGFNTADEFRKNILRWFDSNGGD
jgi:hypothetical protein